MKNKKPYLILLISNIIFFGIFGFWIWYDMQHMSGWGISPGGLWFYPSYLLFVIWYGTYSFKITKKVSYPNIILYIFSVMFLIFLMLLDFNPYNQGAFKTLISNIIFRLIVAYAFTSLSKVFSHRAKSKTNKKEKADEK
jgi:hypothetical protein